MHTLMDVNHSYPISNIELCIYKIFAVKDGYLLSENTLLVATSILPINQNFVMISITLINKNIIYGVIKASITKLLIDNARVMLYKNVLEEKVLVAETNSILDGEYIIEAIDDGVYELIVKKNGYKIVDGLETLVATTYTNIEGKYMFGNIETGSYMVKSKLTNVI